MLQDPSAAAAPPSADHTSTAAAAAAIRGILFDKDGTLIDYDATWAPINRRAADLAAEGDPDLAERLLVLGGADPVTGQAASDGILAAGSAADIAHAWSRAGSPWPEDRLTEALDRLFCEAGIAGAVPVTDLAGLFARLAARGLKLGIASSDSAAAVAGLARRFGIEAYLAFAAGYDSGHGPKPEPGMMQAFCAATGLPPSAVAMVGDSRHDMAMGRAAGAGLCIGVMTGAGSRAVLAGHADFCLDSIDLLDGLLG